MSAIDLLVGDRITFEQQDVSELTVGADHSAGGLKAAYRDVKPDRQAPGLPEHADQVPGVLRQRPGSGRLPILRDPIGSRLGQDLADDLGVHNGAMAGSQAAKALACYHHVTRPGADTIVLPDPRYELLGNELSERR